MQAGRFVPLTMVACLAGLGVDGDANEVTATVEDGIFTAEQARRGEQVYAAECASCHAADMQGGPAARGLRGVTFRYLWNGRTVAELFDAMRAQMPPGKAGSLEEQAYLDVLAAILERNEFPAGETEIAADPEDMNAILIRWRAE